MGVEQAAEFSFNFVTWMQSFLKEVEYIMYSTISIMCAKIKLLEK